MAVRAHDLQRPFGGQPHGAIVYKFPSAKAQPTAAPRKGGLILVSLAAVLGLAAGSWQGTSSATPVRRQPARSVVVQPGDTLWSIASENAPVGVDVRSYLDQILALNGRVPAVAPGWRLELPR
jgi:hypothetical protein